MQIDGLNNLKYGSLDRVLGTEISLAGGSFMQIDGLNNLKYGSDIVNIYADATVPGGLGSFGYDDEGVKAQRSPIVKEGVHVGYLTSRETAPVIGQRSNGTMRADGWNRIGRYILRHEQGLVDR